jgi:hypothetical protein
MQQMMHARRSLEQSGTIVRKDFMLHDRPNWPTVHQAGAGAAGFAQPGGMYPGGPLQHMVGRQPYPPNPTVNAGPPAKRQRQAPPQQLPGHAPPAAVGMAHDPLLDDEDTSMGDFFDHLSPRDISSARYIQHHELLEEVLSSPFSIGQIIPVDLGFGLLGELSGLTDGIFETAKPPKAGQPAPQYQKPDHEQIKKFQERVDEYLAKSRAEIDQIKSDHTANISDLDQGKSFTQAERKLRDAMWGAEAARDSQAAPAVYNVDVNNELGSAAKTDEIVTNVEQSISVKIQPQENATCVDKGGLLEEDLSKSNGVNGTSNSNGGASDFLDDTAFIDGDTASGLLDQFGSTNTSTPANQLQVSQAPSQANSSAPTPGVAAGGPPVTSQPSGAAPPTNDASQLAAPTDTSLTIDGMDLDVDLDPVAEPSEAKEGDGDWVMVGDEKPDVPAADKAVPAMPAVPGDSTKDATAAAPGEPATTVGTQASNTPAMFDPADFDNLDDLDTAGDALADLAGGDDGLDLTMDNGSFGDAFAGATSNGGADPGAS